MHSRNHFRTRSIAAVLASMLVVAPALAQQQGTVARLASVEGGVLVSRGDAMVAAGNDVRLSEGTRVVTTAGAKATISYDVGCDVRLGENQRFTVRIGPCAALLAQVETLGPAAGAIGGGTAGAAGTVTAFSAGGGLAGVVAVGAIAGIALYETFKKNTVSPN